MTKPEKPMMVLCPDWIPINTPQQNHGWYESIGWNKCCEKWQAYHDAEIKNEYNRGCTDGSADTSDSCKDEYNTKMREVLERIKEEMFMADLTDEALTVVDEIINAELAKLEQGDD